MQIGADILHIKQVIEPLNPQLNRPLRPQLPNVIFQTIGHHEVQTAELSVLQPHAAVLHHPVTSGLDAVFL